jgi:hypothetical protein
MKIGINFGKTSFYNCGFEWRKDGSKGKNSRDDSF